MASTTNHNRGGRIRITDDSVVTIGTNVEVRAEHVNAVNATRIKESSDETRKGHRRHLKKLMQWWMIEYPDYFEIGTRVLSEEERNDPMKFYHTCDRDIVCMRDYVSTWFWHSWLATRERIMTKCSHTHT